jgi:hypothetical protein
VNATCDPKPELPASSARDEHTEFLEILHREKSNRAATLANLQAVGIDPRAATACDWFRAGHNITPATEAFTPLWWNVICTRDLDAAIQATTSAIEEEKRLDLRARAAERRMGR